MVKTAKRMVAKTATTEFRYATFSPAEVEAIAGVPQSTQRNWRRAGYLSKEKSSPGRERFDLLDLAQVLTASALINKGIELKHAMFAAKVGANQINSIALGGDAPRFLVVLGTGDWQTGKGSVLRTDTLGAVESQLERYLKPRGGNLGAVAFVAIDCMHLALVLTERAGKPLVQTVESLK